MSESGDGAPTYVGHAVYLDGGSHPVFFTANREKYDEAVAILGSALGFDRVSGSNFGEGDLDEFRSVVQAWCEDPRMTS